MVCVQMLLTGVSDGLCADVTDWFNDGVSDGLCADVTDWCK